MSHITIIISKRAATSSMTEASAERITAAEVTYVPPDSATEQEIGQEVRRLVRQVRNLGEGPAEE